MPPHKAVYQSAANQTGLMWQIAQYPPTSLGQNEKSQNGKRPMYYSSGIGGTWCNVDGHLIDEGAKATAILEAEALLTLSDF